MRTDVSCSLSDAKQEHSWDIADNVFPIIQLFDEFVEYPTGYVKYAYSGTCTEARTHQSGWAARNANNHNQAILKKSCLGVLLCDRQCSIANGSDIVRVRPSICDKARKKQINQPCPNDGCQGRLYLKPCRGHSGYPVTHFWREVTAAAGRTTILFQAKGEHDHPRPERKTTAQRRTTRLPQSTVIKPTRRLKRLTHNTKRISPIKSTLDSQHHDVAAVHSTVTVPGYPAALECQQSASWSSDFYRQSRPTVIRQAWNQSTVAAAEFATATTHRRRPFVDWYSEVNRPVYDKVSLLPNYCQQQRTTPQCPYATTNCQWLPTSCDFNNDVISSGGSWNSGIVWNRQQATTYGAIKQSDLPFDHHHPQTVLATPGYSATARLF